MTWRGAEAAALALSNYLQANFTAKVEALNAEYGDAETVPPLAPPGTFAITEITEPDANAWPLIETLAEAEDLWAIGGGYMRSMHHLSVVCTVMQDADQGAARTMLRQWVYRYARAVKELVRSAQSAALNNGKSEVYTVQFAHGDTGTVVDWTPAFRNRARSQVIAGCIVHVAMGITEAG